MKDSVIQIPHIGKLEVSAVHDDSYPGFIVRFNGEEIALFELDLFKKCCSIHVWPEDENGVINEEPTSYRFLPNSNGEGDEE